MSIAEHTIWTGCYDDSWRDEITPDSFAHPAKCARGLIRRIFDELALGRGSVVVDSFGGIGTTGIEAASRGLRFFGCELEQSFYRLCVGHDCPGFTKADFRRWYSRGGPTDLCDDCNRQFTQVEAFDYRTAEADLFSAPRAIPCQHAHHVPGNFELHKAAWEAAGDPLPVMVHGDSRQLCANLAGVMADVVVGSPPFQGSFAGGGDAIQPRPGDVRTSPRTMTLNDDYGTTPGQLGNLPSGTVDAVVGSPPYEGSFNGGEKVTADDLAEDMRRRGWSELSIQRAANNGQTGGLGYGDTPNQLGNQTGETFWSAAVDIVRQCHQILKPGGVCVWVCKDFVRKGARVPFSDDWRKLCVSNGFELVEWVHASLVKTESHPSLFGGDEITKTTERKSFFRRLAEKKGSPPIDHEDVLIMRRK